MNFGIGQAMKGCGRGPNWVRITIDQLTKRFGEVAALKEVSLEIRPHELFFLLGPSGCGKTTLLRTMAGFYQPDSGELKFGDRRMNGLEPHVRNTGMVFQNYALWPHLSVADNVAYGLDVRRVAASERQHRVEEALKTTRMTEYAGRFPTQLSGGQQQRVALARALVVQPDVLLLDEPLSNLDAQLRLEMRDEIRRIHRETKITTVYVTHDQKEALSLADRMAVMRDGVVEQIGDPRTVYRRPRNRFVADFIGETNWISGRLKAVEGSRGLVETAVGVWAVENPSVTRAGATVMLGFRPESVRMGAAGENTLSTTIAQMTYLGEVEQYHLRVSGGQMIKALEQDPQRECRVGEELVIHVRPDNLFVLE